MLVADVDVAAGEALAAELGGRFVETDVRSRASYDTALATAVDGWGRVDVVHLNAGVMTGCGLGDDFDEETYRRAVGINLDGVVLGIVAARPVLAAHGGGAIVVTASLAGLVALAEDPVYTATKHAVVGLTQAMGPVLAADGIRINAVCPGFAESALIDPIRGLIAGMGLPVIPAAEVADAVLELVRGGMTGECWFVQAGRRGAFRFPGVPGPRR